MKSTKFIITLMVIFTLLLMSSTVMAAVPQGIYIGGTLNKFYTITQFIGSNTKRQEVQNAKLFNVKFVSSGEKATSLSTLAAGTPMAQALKPLTPTDLSSAYSTVDGTTVVTKSVKNITVTKLPSKCDYLIEDTFNSEGLEITARFSDDSTAVIKGYKLSTPDMTTIGIKVITVEFENNSTTFEISVKKLDRIEVLSLPNKTEYEVDEEFISDGLQINAVCEDGTTFLLENYYISVPDMSTPGKKTVTVSFKGITAAVEINVKPPYILIEKAQKESFAGLNMISVTFIVDDPKVTEEMITVTLNDGTLLQYEPKEPDAPTGQFVYSGTTEKPLNKIASLTIRVINGDKEITKIVNLGMKEDEISIDVKRIRKSNFAGLSMMSIEFTINDPEVSSDMITVKANDGTALDLEPGTSFVYGGATATPIDKLEYLTIEIKKADFIKTAVIEFE